MSKTTEPIHYETNAEIRTITGWCCKTCGHYWGEGESGERAAKFCHATHRKCEDCDNFVSTRSFTVCSDCQAKRTRKRFEKLATKPYDCSPIVTFDDDRYFFDEDDLLDYLAERETPADVMLVFAECKPLKWDREVSDVLCDDLAQDMEWDTGEIDKVIAEWVDKNAPKVYWPTKIAVSHESLAEFIATNKTD